MTIKWDRRFIRLAQHIATWSKDPSTQVGCIVVGTDREVLSMGYNGFPRGIEDSEERLHDREVKYSLTVHAEMNALHHAARIGVSLKGCSAYITWPPCTRCAVSLIQAGIRRVAWPKIEIPERWRKDFEMARNLLHEAGVDYRAIVL